MKKRYVILHGGIGNQLFQWAYGHQLASLGHPVVFVFFEKQYLIPHARVSLGDLFPNCSHAEFLKRKIPKNNFLKIILDPTNRLRIRFPRLGRLSDSTGSPFVYPSYDLPRKYQLGYFQNHSMIEEMAEVLYEELWGSLNQSEPTPLEASLFGHEILHVRQGDTKTPSNIRSVGVLDSKYYESLPAKESSKRFVLTDDPEGAREILTHTDVDGIYGPEEIDIKGTLRVMAHSTHLYTANSTLSWWGGFLAKRHGAEVSIPSPFFRSVNPDPRDAFVYSGFQQIPSIFLDA